jgi:hypothetical protein
LDRRILSVSGSRLRRRPNTPIDPAPLWPFDVGWPEKPEQPLALSLGDLGA